MFLTNVIIIYLYVVVNTFILIFIICIIFNIQHLNIYSNTQKYIDKCL